MDVVVYPIYTQWINIYISVGCLSHLSDRAMMKIYIRNLTTPDVNWVLSVVSDVWFAFERWSDIVRVKSLLKPGYRIWAFSNICCKCWNKSLLWWLIPFDGILKRVES